MCKLRDSPNVQILIHCDFWITTIIMVQVNVCVMVIFGRNTNSHNGSGDYMFSNTYEAISIQHYAVISIQTENIFNCHPP